MNESAANVSEYDLRRHGVVEASAGTGKTHTIEQIVLRLITEEAMPIEQILVVTFTEKATGELKVRLRNMLLAALQEDHEAAPLIRTAFDHFDQAPIFTIHGFCHQLTKEFALEQGQDFQADLANDVELLRTLLGEVQRKDWRAKFGASMKAVLEKAGYNRATAEKWDRNVADIAIRYKPRSGHQLLPAYVPDWWRRLDEVDTNWTGQLEIFTIDALHRRLRDFKRQRGLQSFDDMIASVEESLDPGKNTDAENLLTDLRQRYRVGIVDEFQDTDPLQWRIFRSIFLAGGTSRLFIVGDPKQAIFAFRGADLPTYLHAANEMKTDFAACEYPLLVNWRSDADLLEALNCLFGDGEWFPRESGIRYYFVHAPDADRRKTQVESDLTNRAALTIVNLSAWGKLKLAHKNFVRFTAQEIHRLLRGNAGQPLLKFSLKGAPARPLEAGDICVLVMKRTEAEPLTQALDALNIPYNFYKATGLWQTEEAIHLEVLLQTLARPDDRTALRKALLTCFFRVKPAELAQTPDVPAQHPARQLYQTWLGHAENRQWSALCRSLVEDTGLLFPSVPADSSTFQPNVATLEHLLSALEQHAHGLNLDLLGVLEWVQNLRAQRDSESDWLPAETGRGAVQIMTIHAAKGLERPIVFLAGGFTQSNQLLGPTAYRDDQDRLLFNLTPDEDAKAKVKSERLDEQRRLLYVALTRPILKLYVPKVKVTSRNKQFAGPVGSILQPALDLACPDKLGGMIAEVMVPPLVASVPSVATAPEPTPAEIVIQPITIAGPLFPMIDGQMMKRRMVVRSFSSMAKHHLSQVGQGASFGELTPKAEDEAPAPRDAEDPLRGPVFGDMVHKVIEAIDFAEVNRAAGPDDLRKAGTHARKCLDEAIRADLGALRTRTPIDQLEEAARRQIAQLVWQTLTTPLAAVGARLCDIPLKDRRHEVEFLFSERTGKRGAADLRAEEGFVTGFMDLLFRREDRYFLLDWKTNLLPGYTLEHLQRSMTDSDYHRQYGLYLHAARRWLERVHGKKFSFFTSFAGVYYLYVRGMNGHDETTGVFFKQPTEKDLDLKAIMT